MGDAAGGGYSEEATTLARAIDSAPDFDVQLAHHGDSLNAGFVDGLERRKARVCADFRGAVR